MELIDYDISCGRGDVIDLVWMGDPHIGHRNSNRKLFEKQISWVESNPNAHLVLNGDLLDLVIGKDKRVDPEQVDPYFIDAGSDIPRAQKEYVKNTLQPVRKKIVGIHTGNHEETWRIIHYNNVIKELCEELSVPYLTYTAFIRFRFSRSGTSRLYKARSSHGTGNARTKSGILTHLNNLSRSFLADIYAQGHAHRRVLDITPIISVPDDRTYKLNSRNHAYVATGSFFETYKLGGESSYGEKKDYPPGDLGGAYVRVQPFGDGILDACPLLS